MLGADPNSSPRHNGWIQFAPFGFMNQKLNVITDRETTLCRTKQVQRSQNKGGTMPQPGPAMAKSMKARLKRAYIAGTLAFAISWSVASATPAYDFCAMMIPHHQGAIDMAKAV